MRCAPPDWCDKGREAAVTGLRLHALSNGWSFLPVPGELGVKPLGHLKRVSIARERRTQRIVLT